MLLHINHLYALRMHNAPTNKSPSPFPISFINISSFIDEKKNNAPTNKGKGNNNNNNNNSIKNNDTRIL